MLNETLYFPNKLHGFYVEKSLQSNQSNIGTFTYILNHWNIKSGFQMFDLFLLPAKCLCTSDKGR